MKKFLLSISLILIFSNSHAQTCGASNLKGCRNNKYGNITGVRVSSPFDPDRNYMNLSCGTSGPSTNHLINSGAPLKIFLNTFYSLSVLTPYPDSFFCAVWIDKNQNDSFEASEYLPHLYGNAYFSIGLDCKAKTGKMNLRIRTCPYGDTITAAQACGSLNLAGSIYDLELNAKLDTAPKADFSVRELRNFTKCLNKFKIEKFNPNYSYSTYAIGGMSLNNDPQLSGFVCSWSTPGTYDVKMVASYCGMKDSVIKQVKIISPWMIPKADFSYNNETTEIHTLIELYGKTDSGAYKFNWEVTSPSGAIYYLGGQNPKFTLDEIGTWGICMQCQNDVGPSNTMCKFVQCVSPSGNFIGFNIFGSMDSGILYDNGGPTSNYKDSIKKSTSYFQIRQKPDILNTQLTLWQLKMADTGDRLKIYIGEGDTGKALHPAGGFTKNNAPSLPKTFVAATNKIYITFESNTSGNDSGFKITWQAAGKNVIQGRIYFDRDTNCILDDTKDKPLPYVKLKISGYDYSSTHSNGYFRLYSDTVPKIISPFVPSGWMVKCPVSGKDTWTMNKKANYNFSLVPDPNNLKTNFSSFLYPGKWGGYVVVRGLDGNLLLKTQNLGNTLIDSAKCQIFSSRKLKYLTLNSGNYTGTDTSLFFSIGKLDYFDNPAYVINFKVFSTDTGILNLTCKCAPYSNLPDNDTTNDNSIINLKIVNALDPNDKQVAVDIQPDHRIKQLSYFVRFQNTGTWPATDVIVRDTLSSDLDTNSLEILQTSHACVMERQGYAMAFKFLDIQLMDSGRSEPESHGWFHYSIKPKTDLPEKKRIYNTAYIYFDAEKPVVTNTTETYWQLPPFIDTIPPVIILNTTDTVFHQVNKSYNSVAISYSDNFWPLNQLTTFKTGIVNSFQLGLYEEKFTVEDGSGNIARRSRFVKVGDTSTPVNNVRKHIETRPLLYPVPAQDVLHFDMPEGTSGVAQLSIFAGSGKKILDVNTDLSDKGNSLDVSFLPDGIYFLKLAQNGKTYSEVFSILR